MEPLFSSVLAKFKQIKAHNYPLNELLTRTTALLKAEIPHYDWVGFYLFDASTNMLILGPYSGKPTEHTHIPSGKGICGQVAEGKKTMIVQDVTQEANYLSCSIDVRSEIVVPLLREGIFVAEIDIDSHCIAPFSDEDDYFLSAIADELSEYF